jgi:nucleoside-diphosphate-sugar epimerase
VGPADEDEPFREDDSARAALAADEAVLGSDVEGVVARYGYLYGPGTWYSRGGAAAEALHAGTLRAPARGEESLVHVEDAARATVGLVEEGRPGAYNVVDDEPAPRREWLSALAAAVGAPPPPESDPPAPPRRGASNRKLAAEIGWRPRFASWRDGFREGLS